MKNTILKPIENEPGFRTNILRMLNARISPPSWMLALSSCALAWFAGFLIVFGPGLEEFGEALPVDGYIWVPSLIVTTTATVIGMFIKKRTAFLKYGAFGSFCAWIFGGMGFVESGQTLTAVVVVAPWMLFYAYVYLASLFRDETGL